MAARMRASNSPTPKGFSTYIVSATVQRGDLLRLPVSRGKHDDRHVTERPQLPQHVLTIKIGQAEIEQNEIGRARCGDAQALHAGQCRKYLITGRRQRGLEEPVNLRFIVDNQDGLPNPWRAHGATGRRNTISVPGGPSAGASTRGLCALMSPPMAVISPCAIARPRPVPGTVRSPRRAR